MIPKYNKYNFLIGGIGALSSWNAILTSFDFYQAEYPNFDVTFTMALPFFLATSIGNFILLFCSSKITIHNRIIIGYLLLLINICLLPIIATLLKSTLGYGLILLAMSFGKNFFNFNLNS